MLNHQLKLKNPNLKRKNNLKKINNKSALSKHKNKSNKYTLKFFMVLSTSNLNKILSMAQLVLHTKTPKFLLVQQKINLSFMT